MTVAAALTDPQVSRTNAFRVLSFGTLDTQFHGPLENVLDAQRSAASARTAYGATQKHALAVMLSILGQESAGSSRLAHWKEALTTWRELIDDDLFWTTLKDRARKHGDAAFDPGSLRIALCRQLSSTLSDLILGAVQSREFAVVPALARMAMEHRSWLNPDAALAFAGKQILHDGFLGLRTIMEHLSQIALEDDESTIRKSLGEREKELRSVAAQYGAMVRSLGELADGEGWEDAVAASKQRLSAAYVDLLDDPHEGVRLIAQARELAHEPQLLQSIKRDWQHMQRVVFCRDALGLAEQSDFAGAERKFLAALALSTDEEKIEIRLMQNRTRQKREASEQQQRQIQRAVLLQEAGVLLQAEEFARAEYKLAAALPLSADEDKMQIKDLLDQCRWARVLRGTDTSKRRPFLFTSNGIGARFYGNRDYDIGTDSYVTTHWLTFLFVPLFPLAAYRVTSPQAAPLNIHARVGLPGMLRHGRWVFAACFVGLFWWASLHEANFRNSVKTAAAKVGLSTAVGPAAGTTIPATQAERTAILKEQTALSAIATSLQEQQRKLQLEGTDLEKQDGYLSRVQSSYAGEKVPEGGQALLDSLLAESNSRQKEYEKKRAALKTEFAAYYDRAAALKLRVQALKP